MSTFATIIPALVETAAPGVKCPAEVYDLIPGWLSVVTAVLGCIPLVMVVAYYAFKSVSASAVVDWWVGSVLTAMLLALLWFVGTDAHKVYRMRVEACGN